MNILELLYLEVKAIAGAFPTGWKMRDFHYELMKVFERQRKGVLIRSDAKGLKEKQAYSL
jgi:hypothetical protein